MIEIVPFADEMRDGLRTASNRNLDRDTITEWTFRRLTTIDPNFDRRYALVATEGGHPIGFLLGVRRTKAPAEMVEKQKDVAWIKMFFVDSAYRRRRIATSLFEKLESALKEAGIKRVRMSDFPAWDLTSGLHVAYEEAMEFLSRRGYKKVGETVDYEIDLLDFRIPRRFIGLDMEGTTTRNADHSDQKKILDWVQDIFSIFWRVEADEAFKFDKPKIWIAEQGEKIIGFSVYGAFEPPWFGPIGVDPEVRTKGIGSTMLFNCLQDMREEGQRLAVIPWTSHLFFYTQVPGIRRIRHYWIMEKNLA